MLRRRRDARELGQRDDPGRDRSRERLAEEWAERLVLPGLDVARAPVVDQNGAEDVVERLGDRDRLAVGARHAHDEAELELDVELLRRAKGRRVRVRRLALAVRAVDLRAADDDRSGAAVVADRQM